MGLAARWCLACVLALCATLARAQPQPGELAVGTADRYALSRVFLVLEDSGGALTLEDVLRPAQQSRLRPVAQSGSATNFGLTSSAFWLRVVLRAQPDAPADWLLEVALPPLDRVEVYASGEDGSDAKGYERQLGGDLQPFASRAVVHRNHVFPLRLHAGEARTVYLRIESKGTVSAPTQLWQPAALWHHDQREYSALSLYFGLMIGLFLYNLLLYLSIRDPVYLVYVMFVGCFAVAQAALDGMAAQFLWPQWTWWNNVSINAGNAASGALGIQFARIFLATRVTMRRTDGVMRVLVALWLLSLAAALLLPYAVAVWMLTVLAPISVFVLVTAAVVSVRRGHPGARYFLLSWAVLLLGVIVLTLHNTGALPSNVLTANALPIGSSLEMLLLSFALADRINVARREKEQALAAGMAEHAMVEALNESQARYRALLEERETILESSIVGIAFLTPGGRMRWANKAMFQIFGASHEAKISSLEPFYLSREHYLEVGKEVAGAIARGEVYHKELQMRRVDGSAQWVSLSGKAVSLRDLSQGTVWGIMDISRRKQLEEDLQRTSSEREAILNSALVGIVLSVKRRHEWVNEKFAEMMGYRREELIGQSSAYIHPDLESWERFGAEARATLIATGTYVDERQLRRRNGELFWVQMGGSCVRPNDPDSGVIWTFLDITQRRRSEQDTRDALEQQKQLNELRSRFVAMTSHEFRTPLASILSSEELLKHYGERLPAHEKGEILDGIAAAVQRMMRMLDRVLLIGKAEAQMLEFKPALLDLPALCRALVEEARAQAPRTSCEVRTMVAADVGQGLYDEKLLRHIFGNLLSNAIKYSPRGGEVRFEIRCDGDETVFEVSDQGIGIPAEELGHLFESFHRASNVGDIQGTGLGLAIVKNSVEMHGGRISVASTQGQGTCFTVRLPVLKTEAGTKDPARS